MASDIQRDIESVQRIDAVPQILDIICKTTGMGFAAVARVTEDRWVCCAVRDDIQFGLLPGGELQLETTICHEIRQSHRAVVINHVAEDAVFSGQRPPGTDSRATFRCRFFWPMEQCSEHSARLIHGRQG